MTQINSKNKQPETLKEEQVPHIPVLLLAALMLLAPQKGESYLDLTAGYGGHAAAILERTFQPDRAVLVDRDQTAAAHLQQRFGSLGANIIQQDFLSASKELIKTGAQFDIILADLGVSSLQLDMAGRGFSISAEGPLDMRMDTGQELEAGDIVNNYSQAQLAGIIKHYGEEPRAAVIAAKIVANRPIKTTTQLATIVAKSAGRRKPGKSRVHPATRTFQAIRIAVNDELVQLEQSLTLWKALLAPGGRLAVISFHSLEDRIVKNFFNEHSKGYEAEFDLLTKKPITSSKAEIDFNPRARSAKLRAVAKK